MFDYLLYSHPPSRPYKMTGLLPERLQYGLVCCCLPSLRKIAAVFSETILFHVMPLQNDRPLSKPLQNGLLFLFSCFTCFKRSGLQTAQNIFASIYTFSVPPSCPYKVRGPRRNSYNMVWCFVISCAYSHIAEDTPR